MEVIAAFDLGDSVLGPRINLAGVGGPLSRSRALGQVVKDRDYLVDNLCMYMLSEVKAWGQEERGRAAEAVPNWESGIRWCVR
jgi:hypothetical protein